MYPNSPVAWIRKQRPRAMKQLNQSQTERMAVSQPDLRSREKHWRIQSILNICKFTYSPKFHLWLQKQYRQHFGGLCWTCTERQKISTTRAHNPSWCHTRLCSASGFSSHTVNRYPFHNLFSATFTTSLWFLLVISLFKIRAPSAQHWSAV